MELDKMYVELVLDDRKFCAQLLAARRRLRAFARECGKEMAKLGKKRRKKRGKQRRSNQGR